MTITFNDKITITITTDRNLDYSNILLGKIGIFKRFKWHNVNRLIKNLTQNVMDKCDFLS